MQNKLILPELGEGIVSATVVEWLVKEGDAVAIDDDVVEIATDKATFNVSAVCDGKVKQILAKSGEEVKIGGILAIIE
ncbi:MAG: hypothetical protein HQL25_08650 [Candidatus Omnitrophica bacterium]|nr:hypothetical protein [Candidatus Omnitrophota bacterium]